MICDIDVSTYLGWRVTTQQFLMDPANVLLDPATVLLLDPATVLLPEPAKVFRVQAIVLLHQATVLLDHVSVPLEPVTIDRYFLHQRTCMRRTMRAA
jgi:hypothetical protein